MSALPPDKLQHISDLIRIYSLGVRLTDFHALGQSALMYLQQRPVDASLLPYVEILKLAIENGFSDYNIWLEERGDVTPNQRSYRRLVSLVEWAILQFGSVNARQLEVVFVLLKEKLRIVDRETFPQFDSFEAMVSAVLRVLDF